MAFIYSITNVILDGEKSETKTDNQTVENAAVENTGSDDESSEDVLEENFGIRRVRRGIIIPDGTRIIPLQQE